MKDIKLADQLGMVQAQLAELRKVEKELKAAVVAAGERVEGDLFDALPIWAEVDQVNWKAIAETLGPSPQLKAAYTKRSVRVSVKVSARKQEAA